MAQRLRPTEEGSPADPIAKPAAGRWARIWGQLKRFRWPIAGTAVVALALITLAFVQLPTVWQAIVTVASVGAVLSGLAGYWTTYHAVKKGVPLSASAVSPTPVPPAFSIAVLPFASPGATAADELIAREMAPDLTDAIRRTSRYVWIVSPRLGEGYAHKPIDPRAVGRELNVRYLAEGKLRRTGDRLLLTATLTDAATATQTWNEKVEVADAKTEGASTAPSQLISGLRNALYDAEVRRVAAQGPAAASAMDLVIRGWGIEDTSLGGDFSLAQLLEAKKLYDEAFRLDPNLVQVLVSRAYVNINMARTDPHADGEGLLREADQLTKHALALDGDDPGVWNARGWVLAFQRRWEESLTAYREALRIFPNRGATIGNTALVLAWSGRAEESLPWIDKALAFESGAGLAALLLRKSAAYMLLGHYEEAVAACEKSAGLSSDSITYVYLTAAYAQRGDDAKAVATKEQLLKLWPNFTLARFRSLSPSDNPVFWQQVETHLFGGLRKAGVPEE